MHTRRRSRTEWPTLVLLVAGLACATPSATAQSDPYRAPDRPLDSRVNADSITEYDPPPLPEQVLLPLPPDHRIATDRRDVPIDDAHWARAHDALARGRAALLAAQDASGGWLVGASATPTDGGAASPVDVAVTAMAVQALVQIDPVLRDDDAIKRAVAFIRRAGNDDGSFGGGGLSNYVTSTVVSALSTVDEFANATEIRDGVAWLQSSQWDQGEGLASKQDWFGGAGYGHHGRPDLSNTQMMLEAMYDAGLSPDEPAFQRALAFVSRAQNLEATNHAEWAGNDGGFVYTPANGGESMASEAAGEGRYGEIMPAGAPRSLRSYGSMTYAGFKSLLYAGLGSDDLRVRAAFDWIRRHWTFAENPGLGEQGLYYYWTVMARALRVAQQKIVLDEQGAPHNWREELLDAVVARQRADGTWQNEHDRWLEAEPALATTYALLAVAETLKPVSRLAEPDEADGARAPQALRFTITYDAALAEAYTGRVYVMMTTSGRREPRYGPAWFSDQPFFAVDVEGWRPDVPLVVNAENAIGFPGPLAKLAAADYAVQAVMRLNPDTPRIGSGAGNAYSDVHQGTFGGATDADVPLEIANVVAERPLRTSDRIELVERPSRLLSDFHGREIVMRAAVVLPEGYAEHADRRYPVAYVIGGFGADHTAAPWMMARASSTGYDDRLARVVLDPLCFGGHHAFADSQNNGPRGRALVEELIPHLEATYRFAPEPSGRFVTGHSSGGWSSLWLQVAYPDVFGGVWSTAPDPVDFSSYQMIDIYRPEANAYVAPDGSRIPVAQRGGEPFAYYDDFSKMEVVYGEGGQLRSFEWVFSPISADGKPMPLYDRTTGAIDPVVAEAWKAYDIRRILEENWSTLGPRLGGKLHVFVGDEDTFYLHPAVIKLKAALERVGSDAVVEIHPGKNHGSLMTPELRERIDREMVEAFEGR